MLKRGLAISIIRFYEVGRNFSTLSFQLGPKLYE
jgi:hypothetical protein